VEAERSTTDRAAELWQMEQFMISTWGSPADDAEARLYLEAGMNTVMGGLDRLELCRKHDLKLMVTGADPEAAAELAGDPAVWGWYVRDEPPEGEFEKWAKSEKEFRAADPTHPPYVNMLANVDAHRYVELAEPMVLSYDYYQWWWGCARYCDRLELFRDAALKADIPLICWIEANSDQRREFNKSNIACLPDNAGKLRQSVFLALAYGVKGIQWFHSNHIFHRPEEGHLNLSPSGRHVKAINADLQALGPILMKLRSVEVFHTDPVPQNARAVPSDLWARPEGATLTLGLLEDADRQPYLMVVNRNFLEAQPVTLSFSAAIGSAERFDVSRRRWVSMKLQKQVGGGLATELTLAPGDGALLRCERTQDSILQEERESKRFIVRLEQAIADQDKFGAEETLRELERLVPTDSRVPAWREKVAALPLPENIRRVDLGGGVEMDFVLIAPGSFVMGSEEGPRLHRHFANEKPTHTVNITKPFYMGRCEVTQEQWRSVTGANPSHFRGDRNPVENMTYDDCQAFLRKLAAKAPEHTFRLPTEAEWEYACRAGSTSEYSFGDDETKLSEYAWYDSNSGRTTHPVGEKAPNAWGLFDMHGNVWEWCQDWYGDYSDEEQTDPVGPADGIWHILRGGSFGSNHMYCRSPRRYFNFWSPDYHYNEIGLRVVMSAEED